MSTSKPALHNAKSAIVQMSAVFAVICCALIAPTSAAPSSTRSQPPLIASISPSNVGSVEGGTRLTIVGENFAQDGLFSSRAVFIGGQPCEVINYYTTNERIVCITPKCVTQACLSDQDWAGNEVASLSVYVSTVEGILEGFTSYTYNGAYTPSVYKMQHNAWATGISQMTTKLIASQLSDISIKIGEQFADLGNGDEINNDDIDVWSRGSVLQYRAPTDKTAGFFNLSLTVDNDQSGGARAAGLARMYPVQESFQYELNYQYDYNFGVSLAGEPYSVCLLPVVTSVQPSTGSVAGGTVLTVRGHGFSSVKEDMIVYAAGQECDVLSTGSRSSSGKTEEFTCRTRPAKSVPQLRSQLLSSSPVSTTVHGQSVTFQDKFFTQSDLELSSERPYGSAGWWLKLWDYASYSSGVWTDNTVRFSMGLRQPLSLSVQDLFGTAWPSLIGYDSKTDPVVTAIELRTHLVAPYTGTYYFYTTVDDVSQVYGRRVSRTPNGTELLGPEELLVSATYNTATGGQYWPTCAGCKPFKSRGIGLILGERYQLRVRYVNTGGADQIEVAMKIELPGHSEQIAAPVPTLQPVFANTSSPSARPTSTAAPVLSKAPTRNPTASPSVFRPTAKPTAVPTRKPTSSPTVRPSAGPTAAPSYTADQFNFSLLPEELRAQHRSLDNTFMRHHSLKDTQIVSLKIPFFYEVQTLTVTGVTGGTFKLVLQEIYPTADLTFSSSTSAIASALATAANNLAAYNWPVECYSFAVTKAVLNGGSGLQLNITFQISNYYQPLSRTVFYSDDLTADHDLV